MRHVTGEHTQAYKGLSLSESEEKLHKEFGLARMAKDREDVSKIKDYISSHCQNPFDISEVPPTLVNIVSGQIATPS